MKTSLDYDWDILIILDACRYDLFKENYKDFLEGTLEKRTSVATSTPEWLQKTFKDYYKDIIYISANPYCNGKNINYRNKEFMGKERFFKVIDVWDFGYDIILNNVHPSVVNEAFLKYYQLHPNKKFIIHYIQPHYPYISVEPKYIKLQKSHFFKEANKNKKKPVLEKSKTTSFIVKKLMKYMPDGMIWRFGGLLGYKLGVGQIYLDKGWKGIKEAYTGDLRLALSSISDLVSNLDKKQIIITADHGERLGEKGKFGHGGKRDKIVTEVPWFKVKNSNKKVKK
jgi:hypothetical protein